MPAYSLQGRFREQFDVSVRSGFKPREIHLPQGRLRPSFLFVPGTDKGSHYIDHVSGVIGSNTVFSGTITEEYQSRHGRRINYPGDLNTGNRGAYTSWAGIPLIETDFTAMAVVDLRNAGRDNYFGVFSGGWGAALEDRSWQLSGNPSGWYFNAVTSAHADADINGGVPVFNKPSIVVVRKFGSHLSMYVDGNYTSAVTGDGTLNAPSTIVRVGVWFDDFTDSYPLNGEVWMTAYWPRPLDTSDMRRLCQNPYYFLERPTRLRYRVSAGGAINRRHYNKFIGRMG